MNRTVKTILAVVCVVGGICLPALVSHWESLRGRAHAVIEVHNGPPTTNGDNGHAIGIDPIDNTTLTYNGQNVPAHEVYVVR